MPLPRRLAALCVLAATALILLAAPATAADLPAGPTTVVALGDSAVSGEGAFLDRRCPGAATPSARSGRHDSRRWR